MAWQFLNRSACKMASSARRREKIFARRIISLGVITGNRRSPEKAAQLLHHEVPENTDEKN